MFPSMYRNTSGKFYVLSPFVLLNRLFLQLQFSCCQRLILIGLKYDSFMVLTNQKLYWKAGLLHKVKISICISDFMQTTLLYNGNFVKKLTDDQSSSITKESIYHIKHMYIKPFTTAVDWWEIWRLMEVSTMFYTCRYCVFT